MGSVRSTKRHRPSSLFRRKRGGLAGALHYSKLGRDGGSERKTLPPKYDTTPHRTKKVGGDHGVYKTYPSTQGPREAFIRCKKGKRDRGNQNNKGGREERILQGLSGGHGSFSKDAWC